MSISDIIILNETKSTINFSYCISEYKECKLNTTSWIRCPFHKSLYHCLQHHTSSIQRTISIKYKSYLFINRCIQQNSERIRFNNILYKMGKLFYLLMRKFDYRTAINYKKIRCFYSILSFTIGDISMCEFIFIIIIELVIQYFY